MIINYKSDAHQLEKGMKEFWSSIKRNIQSDLKYYALETFPYPSGTGLHMGHPLGYIANDVHVRFMRMRGFEVLYPIGFDSFGLPAEQFAIQTGQHPAVTTNNNIQNMIKQLKAIDLDYNWEQMISTCDPDYYKWTQWFFLKLYDSFFDHTEQWADSIGNPIQGKAKSIKVLEDYLRNGQWHIDSTGNPAPGISDNKKYTEIEIKNALNKARLAYLDHVEVNWCPELGTVLANEEVSKDGLSERGNFPVQKKKLKQWMIRITKYCDRLIEGLDHLDWPTQTVLMQKNWIGKSIGMDITFYGQYNIEIFTTRADTLLGVTFLAVSENHPAYGQKLAEGQSGIFTGQYVVHPVTKDNIPVFVASYVLDGYGSGAVMGVPAHDERDFEFAIEHNLEIKAAVQPSNEWLANNNISLEVWIQNPRQAGQAYTKTGSILDVAKYGLDSNISQADYINWLVGQNIGTVKVNYRLRDWLFSRQRYWGEPFPMVYDAETGEVFPLDESELPLVLPETKDFSPPIGLEDPIAPLAKCTDWTKITGMIINGKVVTQNVDQAKAKLFIRETNTMPSWAGSSWYYLRYIDPQNHSELVGREAIEYWSKNKYATVDLYICGAEHAVLHHLYARFWHMVLFDLDYVPNPEPFQKLIHQGLITADAYVDQNGHYVDINNVKVQTKDSQTIACQISTGAELRIIKGKMGKSYKNGVPPEIVCEKYSIDIYRLYLMYMAPITQSREWNENSIVGMERFCQNICNVMNEVIAQKYETSSDELKSSLNKLVDSMTKHYQDFKFNTGIAFLIEFLNRKESKMMSLEDALIFLRLLYPLAPHLAEYFYQEIRKIHATPADSARYDVFPVADPKYLEIHEINLPITIDGKLRGVLQIQLDTSDEEIIKQLKEKFIKFNIVNHTIRIIRKPQPIIVNLTK